MTNRDYQRWNEREWKRHQVRTLRELTNGNMAIPAGTVCRITGKFGGFALRTEPCSACGVAVNISKVPWIDVDDLGRVE